MSYFANKYFENKFFVDNNFFKEKFFKEPFFYNGSITENEDIEAEPKKHKRKRAKKDS